MTSTSTLFKKIDAELIFTDTDSVNYERKLEDVYEKLFRHKHLFEFSFVMRLIEKLLAKWKMNLVELL